ncbi:DNA gyrase inhibitor YacG [Fretibacter rubidus]|uniref:DNA gyrase inhibitor YacG n=1 Tax=Fretibacter rubidus TaxID=570162 RepID=UPI00352A65E3
MSSAGGKTETCPICKKIVADNAPAPFCSKRCGDIDLGRWLKGNYAIAGQDGEALIPANDGNPDRDL